MTDTNGDGVAESIDYFMSLQVKGAESTGMIFNPVRPTQFIINVQHPESTGVDGGQGDATWMYDLTNVVAPPCIRDEDERGDDDRGMSRFAGKQARVRTCSKSDDTNFIKKLIRAAK